MIFSAAQRTILRAFAGNFKQPAKYPATPTDGFSAWLEIRLKTWKTKLVRIVHKDKRAHAAVSRYTFIDWGNIMSEHRTIKLVEIPIGGGDGFIWNRLHGEREDICEAILRDCRVDGDDRREWLQARLRRVDDALDRLLSGSYGNCSKCGQAIEETRLDMDPALALCLNCWTGEPVPFTRMSSGDVTLASLKPFDTILLQTHNSDYRILLLDPTTGRALVQGGTYLFEPTEALVRGSAVLGDAFRGGEICAGSRLEMWVDDRVFLTSTIRSVHVKPNVETESIENISEALH